MEDALGRLLVEEWGLREAVVTPLDGGMNSLTWTVRSDDAAYVAKWVPHASVPLLAAGGVAARIAGRSGVATGAPVPARDGCEVAALGDGGVLLLEHVEGTELVGETDDDSALMGSVLATVHHHTLERHADGALSWHWVDPDRLLDDELRRVAAEVVQDVDRLPRLATGLCHGDPTPEAFLRSATGAGLIDWGSVVDGPLLYDVASAVMYLGGQTYAAPLLEAYDAAGGPASHDLAHVQLMLRMRWVVQADYFAGRLSSGDLTGVESRADNQSGYDRARRALLVELV